jgi:superfamily II DNA or RNA helicase
MGALNEKNELTRSLYTGFVDFESESLDKYRPKLLINDHKKGKKVLTSLIHELNSCDEFFFSVAFITYSGVLVLLNTLKELEAKNIKGKILASQYLNFTDPNALKKLLSFSNIELRMVTDEDLHAKGYIFRKSEQYNLIVGSSNLTQDALASNKEWNIKVTSTDKGSLILDTLAEFEAIFNRATLVDDIWINEYSKIYQRAKHFRTTSSNFEKIASDSEINYKINPFILPTISPNQMQKEALMGIEKVRAEGENKALLISATGTGKTYLAAFDVAKFRPKRMLFLAHREQILNQSIESFKNVLGHNIHTGLVGGGHRDLEAQYIFSTVQTMSKASMLETLDPKSFDYIIVDESHRAGAESYQKILNYYQPDFLLGMTATPERTDAYNICKDFDYNIAYEIRLEQALEEKMLCPFHYFGITELKISGEEIQEDTEFRYLISAERVNHIIEKIKFYGHQGDYVKGLIFCSRNEEAMELSALFNQRGFRTIALSGSDSC